MRVSTRDLVNIWLICCPTETRRGYRANFDRFDRWLEVLDPPEADRAVIQCCLAYLTGAGLSFATVRRFASAI